MYNNNKQSMYDNNNKQGQIATQKRPSYRVRTLSKMKNTFNLSNGKFGSKIRFKSDSNLIENDKKFQL